MPLAATTKTKRTKRRPVLSRGRLDRYVARIRDARARRDATGQAMIRALRTLHDRILSLEQQIEESAHTIRRLPSAGAGYRIVWKSGADLVWPVAPRGPYWEKGGIASDDRLPVLNDKGRRGKPTAEMLRHHYGANHDEARTHVMRIMTAVRSHEQLVDRFRRAVSSVIDAPLIEPSKQTPLEAARNARLAIIARYDDAITQMMKEAAAEEELLDELMLEFNTTSPGGFGTYSAHWVVKQTTWTVTGPFGPEFRVCLNYDPATGRQLWKPLLSFVIEPKDDEKKKKKKNTAKRKPSGRLTREHIKFARLGKYGDELLRINKDIEALKGRRDERAAKLRKSFAAIKNLLEREVRHVGA